ncbi:hypothetical protein IP91_01740 [Pseudoduganella lurida]|uniref:Protein phosphatase 2C domain-containing protein n=1 Tax=Pseudoduganella lurida TaxID=1036180 RepID=A0A562RFF3_9BURK|nr:hypothetical protein [Pseudoduganella lurida]TWI67623.1 hypothetical protein IP91_01740 [Pseudoduganella lurida]
MPCLSLSVGATPAHNEDHIAILDSPGMTDLLVLDGGTSVAARDYIDEIDGDVVWFVRRFCAAVEPAIAAGLDQREAVHCAIDTVRAAFQERAAHHDVPVHAWPIAALTWIRITPAAGAHRLQLYCLGDCISLLALADGSVRDLDPYTNPQEAVLQTAIARLRAEGVHDPAERHARLLPLLRKRREEQNMAPRPTVLCLKPDGPFAARRHEAVAPAGAFLLGMTDGFYRVVDSYGLHTQASLAALCAGGNLHNALAQLRRHEAGNDAGQAVKKADDASAVWWRAGA